MKWENITDFINLINMQSECKTTKGVLKQNVMLKSILIAEDVLYEAVKFHKIPPQNKAVDKPKESE